MKIIDGKKIAEKIRTEIKAEVAQMIDDEDKAPHLAAVIVGEDPASQTYVAAKEKADETLELLKGLKCHRRQSRTLEATLASLRQLKTLGV